MPATQATKHMKKRLRKENEHKRTTPTENRTRIQKQQLSAKEAIRARREF